MSAYSIDVLADSPLAYYKFNEISGTTAIDSSGNSNDGTYIGGFTLAQAGLLPTGDSSVLLDGTSGYITCPATIGDPFSIEIWFKTSNYTQTGFIAQHAACGIYMVSGEIFITGIFNTNINTGISVPNDNNFHQYVLTCGSSGITGWFYLDGGAQSANVGTRTIFAPSYGISVGGDPVGGDYAQGYFAEFSDYNHVLSPSRISIHYNDGYGIFPGDNLGTEKVKFVDAAGINESIIDSHGSNEVKLHDSSGNSFAINTNPIDTKATLQTSSNPIGTVAINQTGSDNGIQVVSGLGISSGNPLYVSVNNTIFGTAVDYDTTVTLAPGASQTITTTLITSGKKGYLASVYCSSQVAMNFLVRTVNASAISSNVLSLMTTAFSPDAIFNTFDELQISTVISAGSNVAFQVVVTNLDTDITSDAHIFIAWLEN